jgi:heme/copper-type cytochrome/quinol oxidase subunit 2
MPTPCPYCQKSIKKIYILSRPNPLYFKCPHCNKSLKIKNVIKELFLSLLIGGLAGGIWIFLLEYNILEYNPLALVALLAIFIGVITIHYLINIKTQKEIVPATYQPPIKNLKAIILGLILLPTLTLTIIATQTYHIYNKVTTKGILSSSKNFEKNVNMMVQNLEEGKYSEERKTELLKLMAKDSLQYNREYKAFINLINSIVTLIIYIVIVLGAGILLLLKKEKDIRTDCGNSVNKLQ